MIRRIWTPDRRAWNPVPAPDGAVRPESFPNQGLRSDRASVVGAARYCLSHSHCAESIPQEGDSGGSTPIVAWFRRTYGIPRGPRSGCVARCVMRVTPRATDGASSGSVRDLPSLSRSQLPGPHGKPRCWTLPREGRSERTSDSSLPGPTDNRRRPGGCPRTFPMIAVELALVKRSSEIDSAGAGQRSPQDLGVRPGRSGPASPVTNALSERAEPHR